MKNITEGEAFLVPALIDEAYRIALTAVADEMGRPDNERLTPIPEEQLVSVFVGLWSMKWAGAILEPSAQIELVQAGLVLQTGKRDWLQTRGFANFARSYDLRINQPVY